MPKETKKPSVPPKRAPKSPATKKPQTVPLQATVSKNQEVSATHLKFQNKINN